MKKKFIVIYMITIFLSISILPNIYAESKNNNPMLKGIKINGKDIEPEFDMFTTEYVLSMEETIVEIQAIPDDENANVEIIGDKNLKQGRNEFEIKVTAENGIATQSYYIYITRGDSSKANANLKSLKIENYELAPNFEKNTIDYAFEYPQSLEQVEIEAIPEGEKATVEIIGNERLIEVSQTIEVKVTAEDGQTVKTYYIIAKKANMEVEDSSGIKTENIGQNIIKNEEEEIFVKENSLEEEKNYTLTIVIVVILIMISIISIIICKRKKSERNESKNEG